MPVDVDNPGSEDPVPVQMGKEMLFKRVFLYALVPAKAPLPRTVSAGRDRFSGRMSKFTRNTSNPMNLIFDQLSSRVVMEVS